MNSNISTIVGFVAFLCITLTVAIHLKPQIPLTWVDDPNEFVVSFNTECLKAKNEGVPKIPMNLFNLSCIETNNFNFSTPNVVDPNDVSAKYDETAIFFTIADDSACLDNATVEHECLVYVAYSPKLFWDGSDSKAGLNFSACLSDSTTGLPDSDAINLDLLNNIRPYLTNNDKTFDYYPILDSDDPAVDIYAFERNININHIEFDEGIRDQIVLDGTASGDPSHGTQVLSVMIGANYGILRGWPGDNTNSKAYVYRGKGPGDLLAAFKTWSGSPTKYLQKTKRRAIINLSFGFWLNLDNIHHSNFKQTLSNAIDKAIQKKAILVASAGQDETRKNGSNSTAPWLPDGVNICQDTPRLLDVDGTWRRYPGSFPTVITAGAFTYASKDVQPTNWTHYGGSCVDLWAMGEGIIAPDGSSNTSYTTVSGTSFAAPTITSLAAVELARNSKLKGEKAAMVKRLKQCGRGFWIKPATEVKCPQPDTCWASSYICDEVKCNKVDVALLVDVSKKMTTKECKRQQLEVAETLAGFRGNEVVEVGEGDDKLKYPRVRVAYIEFDDHGAEVMPNMNDDPVNEHNTFEPADALQSLCHGIRTSPTCNETAIKRNDNPADLNKALAAALGEFEQTKTSDDLDRDKKILIFSNHGIDVTTTGKTICDNHEKKIRTGSSKDSSEIKRKDNENGVNVVMVNNRPADSMSKPESYLMCLVEYDPLRIMTNNDPLTMMHFPFIEAIHDEICETPTAAPTTDPTTDPTIDPTWDPTRDPTTDPTRDPTIGPTFYPTSHPTSDPSLTSDPTLYPTTTPSSDPTTIPTSDPTLYPTTIPTTIPTSGPTTNPTTDPTDNPATMMPTSDPTLYPTSDPTSNPSNDPTSDPTTNPTTDPTDNPATTSTVTSEATSTSTLTCGDIGLELRRGKKPMPHDCQCQSECGGRYCNPFAFVTERLNYEFDTEDEELLCDGIPGSVCCCSCPNCHGFIPFAIN